MCFVPQQFWVGQETAAHGSWALKSINVDGMWVGPFLAARLAPVFIPPSSTFRDLAQQHAKQKALSLSYPYFSSNHVRVSSIALFYKPGHPVAQLLQIQSLSCHWESDKVSLCWGFMENVTSCFFSLWQVPEKSERVSTVLEFHLEASAHESHGFRLESRVSSLVAGVCGGGGSQEATRQIGVCV